MRIYLNADSEQFFLYLYWLEVLLLYRINYTSFNLNTDIRVVLGSYCCPFILQQISI